MFKCRNIINKKLFSVYLNTQKKNVYAYKSEYLMEVVNMSWDIYGDIQNLTHNNTPPLIVMHCIFGSKSNWSNLCKALAQETLPQRVVIPVDARNHGDSPHSLNHTYEIMAEDVRALYNELNITKASIMGHSMGGLAMMYFALKYPSLVEKVIVIDVSPISVSPTIDIIPTILSLMENTQLPSNIPISAAKMQIEKEWSKSITNPVMRSFLLTNIKQNSDGRYSWKTNFKVLKSNFKEHIKKFPAVGNAKYEGPILFLIGAKSNFIPESDYEDILKLFPKAEFEKVFDAGHWLYIQKPAAFLKLSLEFLNKAS